MITSDRFFGHRRRTVGVTEDAIARGVIFSRCATREDELQGLAVLQGALLDHVASDLLTLEGLEHLTGKEGEQQGTGISSPIKCTRPCKGGLERRRLMCHFKE